MKLTDKIESTDKIGSTDSHEPILENLKAYADGELNYFDRRRVTRHLETCADCRKELTVMETITKELRADTADALGLNENLRARILASAPAANDFAPVKIKPLWQRKPLLLATVAASFATAGILFNQMYGETLTKMNAAPSDVSVATGAPAASVSKAEGRAEDMPAAAPPMPVPSLQEAAKSVTASPSVVPIPMRARELGRNVAENSFAADKKAVSPSDAVAVNRRVAIASGAAASTAPLPPQAWERAVNRNANLGIAVAPDTLEEKSGQVEDAVKASGGYIASNTINTGTEGLRTANIVAKVPVKEFDSVVKKIGLVGRVISKNLAAEDITDQTGEAVSAETALQNEARELEAKLKQSQSEKSTARREWELREARIRLAQTRDHLGQLRKMGAMSTITVSIVEKAKEVAKKEENGFWSGMNDTNKAATAAFQTALRVPLVMLMWVLAFSPIWAPLIIAWRWASRRPKSVAVDTKPAEGSQKEDSEL